MHYLSALDNTPPDQFKWYIFFNLSVQLDFDHSDDLCWLSQITSIPVCFVMNSDAGFLLSCLCSHLDTVSFLHSIILLYDNQTVVP